MSRKMPKSLQSAEHMCFNSSRFECIVSQYRMDRCKLPKTPHKTAISLGSLLDEEGGVWQHAMSV